MELTDIQEIVERSIFEAIRKILVDQGYIPDITTISTRAEFDAQLKAIQESSKGFAVEIFDNGSSQSKGTKQAPRIVIEGRRVLEGDIGNPEVVYYEKDPNDPDSITATIMPSETSNLQLDVFLVSKTAKQDRFLTAVMNAAIGTRKYLPMYNNPGESFFIRQYNYYDLPDVIDGITENIYSYEVTDLYLFSGKQISDKVSLIKEINVESIVSGAGEITANGTIIGPYINDGILTIDLSGIIF